MSLLINAGLTNLSKIFTNMVLLDQHLTHTSPQLMAYVMADYISGYRGYPLQLKDGI